MINLHVIYEDIYNGINDALPFVLADAGNFVGNFSPIVEDISDQQKTKLVLDAIQLGMYTRGSLETYLLALPWRRHSGNATQFPSY